MSSEKVNILVAYPYAKPPVFEALKLNNDKIRFVLDSGAFTAWKANKPIKLDDYCSFLETCPVKPWRYFALDIIGDPEGSHKNYEIMLARGFKPIPVFTRGEDLSMIDEYYKTSDLLAIGGLVGTHGNRGFINGIMEVIKDRKVHWLGYSRLEYIKHYRPYMCDSSYWNEGSRFGRLKLYDGFGRYVGITRQHMKSKPSDKIIKLIKSHGLDIERLKTVEGWRNTKEEQTVRVGSYRSGLLFHDDIVKNTGTLYFLACSYAPDIQGFIDARKWRIQNDI